MEHRHELRIDCKFDIKLYRKQEFIGLAAVKDASKSGLSISPTVALQNKELIHIRFPEKAELYGWPADALAIVSHAENDTIGLLLDATIFNNLPDLQTACDEISCWEAK